MKHQAHRALPAGVSAPIRHSRPPSYAWNLVDAAMRVRFIACFRELSALSSTMLLSLTLMRLREHNGRGDTHTLLDAGMEFCRGSQQKSTGKFDPL